MKVVMVGPYPEPGAQVAGGVERVIDTLLPVLARAVDLTLVVPGASCDAESTNYGVRTVYLKRGPGPGSMRYWTFDAHRLARAIEGLKPDIVHLQDVAGVGRLIRGPAIFTVHGIIDRDLVSSGRGNVWGPLLRRGMAHVMRIVESRGRNRIGNVILINPYVLEAQPDIGRLRTFAIPNPVDPAFFETVGQSSVRERRIISVGNIGPRKNILEVLRVAACLMKQDTSLTLVICGKSVDDAYQQKCLDLIRSEGLESRISLPGNLAALDLLRLLDKSACLLMASRQETAPVAIAEANARGVPVVAPQSFGIKHMVVPGRNGFFLPAGDLDTQASVLRRALEHDWDRAGIAKEAQQNYDVRRIAEMTISAYGDVLGASH